MHDEEEAEGEQDSTWELLGSSFSPDSLAVATTPPSCAVTTAETGGRCMPAQVLSVPPSCNLG